MKSLGRRATIAIAVVAGLAVLAGGWFLLIQPTRSSIAKTKSQTAQQQSDNQSAQLQLQSMRSIAKHLPAEQAELAALAEEGAERRRTAVDPAVDAVPGDRVGRAPDELRADHPVPARRTHPGSRR